MMEQICRLLESQNGEVQCAAAIVLGELQPKDAAARKALEKALKSGSERVQWYSLEAIERIGAEKSLPKMVPLLGAGGRVRARASEIFLQHGEQSQKLLHEQLKKASPSVRRGILDVLGQTGGKETIETLLDSMLDEDFAVLRQASDSLIDRARQMEGKDRAALSKKVVAFLNSPKVKKNAGAAVGAIKVLGHLEQPAAVPVLLAQVGAKSALSVRTHALNSLAHIDVSAKPAAVLQKLLPLLEEPETEIVERTLRVLKKVEPPKSAAAQLIKLARKGAQPDARVYAVRALGSVGSAPAASALLEALFSDDPRISGAAAAALRANPGFAPGLVAALGREKDQQKQWKIAEILRTFGRALGAPAIRKFLQNCLKRVRKKDPAYRIDFEVVRTADPDKLRETLLKEGRALLKKKKYEEAETILRLLDRDDLATDEAQFTLAICRLRTLRKDLRFAPRDQSHSVSIFSRLARKGEFPLVKRLSKETSVLKAEDFLYLGFCFAERMGVERDLGGQILKFVAKKYGSKSEGKTAKQKLQTQGFK